MHRLVRGKGTWAKRVPKFVKMQEIVHLSARTCFSNPPDNRRQMAVEKMKVKPSCRRLIRSISSWMPRSNRSGSAKSGSRRSRNTLLTMLAAGISRSSVVRRFMGIIIRSQLPSSAIFCRDRHSAKARNRSRAKRSLERHSLAHRRAAASRRWFPDRGDDAPSPDSSRQGASSGQTRWGITGTGWRIRNCRAPRSPTSCFGTMRSSFHGVKPNRPRPANLPGSRRRTRRPLRRRAKGHGIGDQQFPDEQGKCPPRRSRHGETGWSGRSSPHRCERGNGCRSPAARSRCVAGGNGPPTGAISHTIAGAGLSTAAHRSRPRPVGLDFGGQQRMARQHGAHGRLEGRPIQAARESQANETTPRIGRPVLPVEETPPWSSVGRDKLIAASPEQPRPSEAICPAKRTSLPCFLKNLCGASSRIQSRGAKR